MTATATAAEGRIVAADQELDTPCVVIDEAILHENIAEMAAFAASVGVALRPHMKTHKTPQVARLQLAAGAVGATCAKVGEAEALVEEGGVEDVLLAYPVVGEPKIRRLLGLMERARVIVALDSREAGEALARAMAAAERTLEVYVEVNTGQDRAGARHGAEATALALELARFPSLRVVGVMTHEGHASISQPEALEAAALEAGRALVETAAAIRSEGVEIAHVSVGSTPCSRYTPTVSGVTEMRPGTYVFNDNAAFRHGHLGPERCAARIATTVVSRPAPDRAVIDAGSKALAMDGSPSHAGHGYLVGHPAATIARLSEEHGVVVLPPDEPGFAVGDRHEVIPNHVCPTINLTDELLVVRDGRMVDAWRVAARGKVR
ncbi:MAG: Type III PLP / low-specificity D-threonine aldolase [uncultured Thermomicrobiales bacterium]|uniref:Type III PLP / low-specificity D-threonine aldolase n=1 Tax=uncultured Thermomicrobiales bacterium TaxID=1645740 RepID=A0A6J4V383_9BACT|nr:MAG: Type III PLP / low-specificity D-threonine aldolase [uncultured Thermomicrobiales bacterium]